MLFSTLTFTFTVTIINNLIIFFVILPPVTDFQPTFYCMSIFTMLFQAIALLKYDTILTKYYWQGVKLSLGKSELEELMNSSHQGVLIFNRETKSLLL